MNLIMTGTLYPSDGVLGTGFKIYKEDFGKFRCILRSIGTDELLANDVVKNFGKWLLDKRDW